jgi:two-component system sensor histidine kinase RegB
MRGTEMPGLGLGFFIAKTLLARAGAKISLENKQFPQRGAIVKVRWKRADFERQRIWEKQMEVPLALPAAEKMPAEPLA